MKHKLLILFLLLSSSIFAQNKNQSIGFKENKGQIIDQKGKPNPDVKFLLNTHGLNVQIKNNGFSYDIYETKKHPLSDKQKEKLHPFSHSENNKEKLPDYSLEYIYHRIDIDFVNSNPKVELVTEEKSKDYDNYYNVPNKPDGVLMVHQYKQITYKNIYPNIDVVFSIPKDSLKAVEYNFVVHPNGKISDIQLKLNGAKTDLVDNKIRMQVRFGEMEETLPTSWTENGKDKKEIAVGYKKIRKDVYGFESKENIANKTVIIDPVPTRLWGTFYGDETNSGNLTFTDIDTDIAGNIYFTGYTMSKSGSYATSGAHQTSVIDPITISYDGIIVKFDSDEKRLWGTFYGGKGRDLINGLKIDFENNLIVTGNTDSKTNISTTNTMKGYEDAFLVKFNSSGERIWGRYFGGEVDESAFDVDVDISNNIYIVGTTRSYTGISINNTYQTLLNNAGTISNSSNDAFIAKFDKNGIIIWSTYVGGESLDELRCIKVGTDFLVTGGNTFSTTNISTPGTFQENHNSSIFSWDGMVFKFSLDGNRIWSTYYGGESGLDLIKTIELDDENNVYIGGTTGSKTNIATSGCFDESNNMGLEKGFIAKLNKDGQRVFGTYFGAYTIIYSIIYKNNFLYLGGMGGLNPFYKSTPITTPCAYKREGLAEGYIGKFSTSGNLIMGTFTGGFDQYSENKISVKNNNIIIGGTTVSTIETDSNSYQQNLLGSKNFYLMKFTEDINFSISASLSSNSPVCIGKKLTFNVDSGYDYSWSGPNGFSSNLQNPFIDNTTIANNGVYNLIVSNNCGLQKSYDINIVIGDIEPPVPNLATLPTITGDCNTIITTIPTATDACAGAITATTASPLSYSLPGTYTIVWDYDDGNTNISHQNQKVTINNKPLPTVTSPQYFCIQQNTTINEIAITGQNIKWYDTSTNGNLLTNTTSLQSGITYYASQTINGCESSRTPILINIQNTAAPTATTPQSFCTSQNPTLNNLVVAGTTLKWYDATTAGNLLPISTPLQDGKTYYATQTLNDCENPTRLAVSVSLITSLPANNYSESFCDDLNDGTETVNLSNYNSDIISNNNYNFSYYNSHSGAENETAADKISNITNYKLVLGDNNIYVRVNSNTPCYAVSELKLTLFSKPKIAIEDIVPICENKTISIDAGSGFDSYLWSNGVTNQSISVANPGNYWVTVTNDYGTISCSSTKNFVVKKSIKATINTIETKDWTDNDNVITVLTTVNGDFEYSIDGYNYQDSNQFTGLKSGQYTVSVRDKNGCGTTPPQEVYLLMFPKFFTPNGDGYNDTWKIKFSDIEQGLTVKIFDRYGKFIINLDSNTASWNGTYNGNNLPADDYWFVVTRANGKEYKGHFSLKR